MMRAAFAFLLILALSSAADMVCGDGYCEDWEMGMEGGVWEDCSTCPKDCACTSNQTCAPDTYEGVLIGEKGCVTTSPCGDRICEGNARFQRENISENCESCLVDCGCDLAYWGPNAYCGTTVRAPFPHCVDVGYCGDGVCDWEKTSSHEDCIGCPENCATCPEDCNCLTITGLDEGVVCNATSPKADSLGCYFYEYCGNNYCSWGLNEDTGEYGGETCKDCPGDCACLGNESCEAVGTGRAWDPPSLCINPDAGTSGNSGGWSQCPNGGGNFCFNYCGNGYCEPMLGENCGTCTSDCGCGQGETCDTGSNSQDSRGCAQGVGPENITEPQAEVCYNGVDDDKDGLVDCADKEDCSTSRKCAEQVRNGLSLALKDKYIEELKRLGMDAHLGTIDTYYTLYGGNPEKMIIEMSKYMDEKVYKVKQTEAYLGIFKDDPEKLKEMNSIIERNKGDLIMRDIELQSYIAENSKQYKDEAMLKGYVEGYVLNPPKWLYGGEYNSGGAIDWANFGSKGIISLTEAVGGTPPKGLKTIAYGTTVVIAVYDAKDLLDKAETLRQMQTGDNTKVGIVVLDGTLKIAKILDPTGYFGNLGDATVGKVIQVGQQIEERRQGCTTWDGRTLCQQGDGSYRDFETNAQYDRVSGGWFSNTVFAERR